MARDPSRHVPRHRVQTLEFELDVDSVELGQALIERVSQVHPRRIAPLLERVLDQLSGPERLDRIDTLELDLGELPLVGFEDELVRALEAALRRALARQIADAPPSTREGEALALLETFARTGNLPWSAAREREVVGEALALVRDARGRPALALLGRLADDAVALGRLVRHGGEELVTLLRVELERAGLPAGLDELRPIELLVASLLADARAAELAVLEACLAGLGRAAGRSSSELRDAVLLALLERVPALFGALRRELASPRGPTRLAPDLRERVVALVGEPAPGEVASALESRDGSPRGESESQESESRESESRESESRESQSRDSDSRDSESQESDSQESESRESESRESDSSDSESPDPEPRGARVDDADPRDSASPDSDSPDPESWDSSAPDPPEALERQLAGRPPAERQPAPLDTPALRATRRRALESIDWLEVDDAGLVILWPFLPRFFARVGLLDAERRFVDEPAVMQAIALLAQIAREQPEPPEWLLALAKLLCGRAPEQPFALTRPLAPAQLDECERLLEAVIANAPILREMKPASFRRNFVRRPALLGVREGAWLLQVERAPHDLVLERFPWSWSWLKLPWMDDPLRVEW